jgi:hypothetical protein
MKITLLAFGRWRLATDLDWGLHLAPRTTPVQMVEYNPVAENSYC